MHWEVMLIIFYLCGIKNILELDYSPIILKIEKQSFKSVIFKLYIFR